jgi:6-phosphogluconolactonase
VAGAAAEMFARAAADAVAVAGRFAVALSGGSTPRRLYRRLGSDPWRARLPWDRCHLFFGDERAVPPDHPDSNYRMVRETLLDAVPIPAAQVHRIRAEADDPERAAHDYEDELAAFFGRGVPPRFDLVLLGMGEDGHTASLFPGSPVLEERRRWVAAPWVEAKQARRLTLTLPVLNQAALVLFLVCGPDKAGTLPRVLRPETGTPLPPAARIAPATGRLVWLLDGDAARDLPAPGTAPSHP